MNWTNWSGEQQCSPTRFLQPETESELQSIVTAHAGEHTIRVAGSGHSFSPIVPTDSVLLSLSNYTGITAIDHHTEQVTVRAGTQLRTLAAVLADHGLALENMGDVDAQTVAGALATGTHGTGIELGILPTQIAAMKIVTGDGTVRTLEPDDGEEFRAGQLSLGTLGIVSEVTLDVCPSYRLREHSWVEPLDDVLDRLDSLRADHRHVEFFWFPHTDRALVKTLDRTDEAPTRSVPYRLDERAENLAWGFLCRCSSLVPRLSPRIAAVGAAALGESRAVGPSHEVFPTIRDVRFNEMEYGVPADDGPAVVRRLREAITETDAPIVFPIEFRYTRGDDILLSPAYQRASAFVAVHAYHRKPYRSFFDSCEAIFRAFDGRPHWGKMQFLDPEEHSGLYPRWETFASIRESFDPEGTFLNTELARLFE